MEISKDTVYITLSIAECLQMGYFRKGEFVNGAVEWKVEGRTVATIGFATDTRDPLRPYAVLSYTYNGTPHQKALKIKETPTGWAFICPITGKRCTTLYLVDGEFMSRYAPRPTLRQRALSNNERMGAGVLLHA